MQSILRIKQRRSIFTATTNPIYRLYYCGKDAPLCMTGSMDFS